MLACALIQRQTPAEIPVLCPTPPAVPGPGSFTDLPGQGGQGCRPISVCSLVRLMPSKDANFDLLCFSFPKIQRDPEKLPFFLKIVSGPLRSKFKAVTNGLNGILSRTTDKMKMQELRIHYAKLHGYDLYSLGSEPTRPRLTQKGVDPTFDRKNWLWLHLLVERRCNHCGHQLPNWELDQVARCRHRSRSGRELCCCEFGHSTLEIQQL